MEHTESSEFKSECGEHSKTAKVSIDGRKVKLKQGIYSVGDLKAALDVPSEYELERVQEGAFIPLDEMDQIRICGDEEFISHVRCGSSS
jgi:hypothetical protein